MEGNLTLDPQIKNWVVIPLIVITVFVGIGRRWLMQLLRPGAKKLDKDESTHRYTCPPLSFLTPFFRANVLSMPLFFTIPADKCSAELRSSG